MNHPVNMVNEVHNPDNKIEILVSKHELLVLVNALDNLITELAPSYNFDFAQAPALVRDIIVQKEKFKDILHQ